MQQNCTHKQEIWQHIFSQDSKYDAFTTEYVYFLFLPINLHLCMVLQLPC